MRYPGVVGSGLNGGPITCPAYNNIITVLKKNAVLNERIQIYMKGPYTMHMLHFVCKQRYKLL